MGIDKANIRQARRSLHAGTRAKLISMISTWPSGRTLAHAQDDGELLARDRKGWEGRASQHLPHDVRAFSFIFLVDMTDLVPTP